jgi:hypothetical protein
MKHVRKLSLCPEPIKHNNVAARYANKVAKDMPLFGLAVSWTLQEQKTGPLPGSFPLFPLPWGKILFATINKQSTMALVQFFCICR